MNYQRIIPVIGMLLVAVAAWLIIHSGTSVESGITGHEAWENQIAQKRTSKQMGEVKMDEPDKFQAFHHGIRTRAGDERPAYTPNYRLKA
ncbi:MAG: hypothetical protein R3345_09095, partial [Fulvivirga sp.]|nr:hypothetical protein [Fulvivirga sp.]